MPSRLRRVPDRMGVFEASRPGRRARGSARQHGGVVGPASSPGGPGPTWATWAEACGVVVHRPHLRATIPIALLVGTVLFAINQLDVVLAGDATTATWVKAGATYGVPFVVANLGILTATRRRP
ncbi:MAG: nitrate/nitrite transporter NrtS [Acidimicrobiales bacterium]